jgi:hypothetical protein
VRGLFLRDYLASFATAPGVISLVMFLLFAAMPPSSCFHTLTSDRIIDRGEPRGGNEARELNASGPRTPASHPLPIGQRMVIFGEQVQPEASRQSYALAMSWSGRRQ